MKQREAGQKAGHKAHLLTCSVVHVWAWTCALGESECSWVCGDGMRKGAGECDDGNTASGDGCSRYCMVEVGYTEMARGRNGRQRNAMMETMKTGTGVAEHVRLSVAGSV
jgi:cysteine-rich repeat protein